jgi:hypothetical protein
MGEQPLRKHTKFSTSALRRQEQTHLLPGQTHLNAPQGRFGVVVPTRAVSRHPYAVPACHVWLEPVHCHRSALGALCGSRPLATTAVVLAPGELEPSVACVLNGPVSSSPRGQPLGVQTKAPEIVASCRRPRVSLAPPRLRPGHGLPPHPVRIASPPAGPAPRATRRSRPSPGEAGRGQARDPRGDVPSCPRGPPVGWQAVPPIRFCPTVSQASTQVHKAAGEGAATAPPGHARLLLFSPGIRLTNHRTHGHHHDLQQKRLWRPLPPWSARHAKCSLKRPHVDVSIAVRPTQMAGVKDSIVKPPLVSLKK